MTETATEVIEAQRNLGLLFSVNFLYSCVTGAIVVVTGDSKDLVLKDNAWKNHLASLVLTLYIGAAGGLLPVSNLRGNKLKIYGSLCWVMTLCSMGAHFLSVLHPRFVLLKKKIVLLSYIYKKVE